jgi:hypothetical protein
MLRRHRGWLLKVELMKSPWKFLVELASRRPTIKVQENPVGQDRDDKIVESEAQQLPAIPISSPEASTPPNQGPSRPADLRTTRTAPEADAYTSSPSGKALDVDIEDVRGRAGNKKLLAPAPGAKSDRRAKTPRLSRIKPTIAAETERDDGVALNALATSEIPNAQPPSSRDSLLRDAANLDEEIKRLKRQLAHKLRSQNVQLKKFLERFEHP